MFVALLLLPLAGRAQGTFVNITFDGPPLVPRGVVGGAAEYYEAGMWFRSVGSDSGFERAGGGITQFPENGTAYIGAGLSDFVKVTSANGAAFGLVSVDLAEYSTVKYANGPVTVHFIGYHFDGSFVTTQFTTDGFIDGTGPLPDFQTFYFDSRFTGLQRVEIPHGNNWWLDNLVVAVPEPSFFVLFGLGGLFAAARLLHQRRSKR